MIAIAPLFTDLPIVLLSIYLLETFSASSSVLGVLSILGGIFLIYLGIKNFTSKPGTNQKGGQYKASIKYGIITNLLSPHPYLFWITVGAPTFIKASREDAAGSYLFVGGFYLLFFGSKIVVAILTGFFKDFLQGKSYENTLKALGVIIIMLAFVMIYEGIELLLQ
jgi:threonine/homoserine/homoserine lactone efflux protein